MQLLQVLAGGCHRILLELPSECMHAPPNHEPFMTAILRHILEDPATLQAAMEAEIRNTLSASSQRRLGPLAAGTGDF